MKIGIVSNLYPPLSRGGAELIAGRISDDLYGRGHEIFVLTSTPFSGLSSLRAEQVTERHTEMIYRFFPLNLYHTLSDGNVPFAVRAPWHLIDMYAPFSRYAMARLIRREQPDVLLTHNVKGLGLQLIRAIRASGIKHIHTVHDVQLSVPSGLLIRGKEDAGLNRGLLRKSYERQVQDIFGSPDVVISPSAFLADFYRDRGFFPASNLQVIPNPAPQIEVGKRPKRLNGTLRILFAGQLEDHKGIPFLLEALNGLDMDFRLHIAGEGALSSYVTEWSNRDRRVVYHGFVSLEHLFQLFDIADVVVVPSLCYENSPTVIYEAFQAGLPVIASDIGGVGELVKEGQNGLLFEPGNTDAFLQAIHRFGSERERFEEAASSIREEAKKYSLRRYVDRLEDLMK